ncbi:hypothetical protein ACWIFI_06105 [Streptomyces albidoflavus]
MTDPTTDRLRALHRDAYTGTTQAGSSCSAGCGAWPCATIRILDEQPPPADRAAVLRDAADRLDRLGLRDLATQELRRMADEAGRAEVTDRSTLAAALSGLETLIATSSRDWGTHRVDAWIYAVLVGWDCEEDQHDETCTHGALESAAVKHGWTDGMVAKARRYRDAVRRMADEAETGGAR